MKSLSLVLTIIMVAWFEKHHNNPEYQLLLRKAKGWITKSMKANELNQESIK